MNSAVVNALLDLNRRFYEARGQDFSATRLRLQPGVKRLVDTLRGDESILDLGCGNGQLAQVLSDRGHRGAYLGLDFSPVLLERARGLALSLPARFHQVDLSEPSWDRAILDATSSGSPLPKPPFDLVMCFAVLHHLPSVTLRSSLLCQVHDLLAHDGRLLLSNWLFSANPRQRSRIQPWSLVGLTAADVDPNDYLLDWKRGGPALRYVHEFSEPELGELASSAGFTVESTFFSDGADRRSSLYQTWRKAAPQ